MERLKERLDVALWLKALEDRAREEGSDNR